MNLAFFSRGLTDKTTIQKRACQAIRHAAWECLESRVHLSATIESVDGTGNNIAHPAWGAAGSDLIRLSPAAYSDGISSPSLAADQSARAISNILNNQADPSNPTQDLNTLDQNNLSDFGYVFGQFMDHDLDLTLDGGDSFPITVAANDPIGQSLPFTRSKFDPATGTSTSNPRQQVTSITAYLDLSQVYGSDRATADALRTKTGGLMKTSPGNLLPYDNSTYFTAAQLQAINASVGGMANLAGLPQGDLFVAGDSRANENLELTAVQTLFVRNHNLLATKLAKAHPTWTDERLYQEARKLNIADYQNIVYNEFIPAVYGKNALPAYHGYNPKVDAGIFTEFSTVAYRFGHSMVSPTIARQGNDGLDVADEIQLSQDFFDPYLLSTTGATDPFTGEVGTDIGPVLKADADGNGQAMDLMAVSSIRNLLFGFGAGGEDLMALDVQRGRDHGIGDYNTLRAAVGLPKVTSFAQITSNVAVQQELAAAYPGGVNTIDAFEGGLAETHVPGSDVGPLFQRIMTMQFAHLRDGDRFFYLNQKFTPEEMALINQGNALGKVIAANTNITNLQGNVMIFRASIGGSVMQTPPPPGGPKPPPGIANITVQLQDADGNVLATTKTDHNGHYVFTNQTGIEGTGVYSVSAVLPTGATLVSPAPGSIAITRGDINATANFVLSLPKGGGQHLPPPPPPLPPPPPPPSGTNRNPPPPGGSGPSMPQQILGMPQSSNVAMAVLGMDSDSLVKSVVH